MKVIKHSKIYTMDESNTILDNYDVLFDNEKIINIGKNLKVDSDVEIIDAEGCILTPGLIDAHTHVGIWEDGNETSHPYTPLLHAVDAINPHDDSFKDARSGGVTTVQTGSGSSNPIGGVWTVIKTAGNVVEDMVLRERSGLKGATGENAKNRYGQIAGKDPYTRMSIAKWIRQGFQKAQELIQEGKSEISQLYKEGNEEVIPFIEVLEGKMPLRIHAHRADDIVTAIRIAKQFKIDLSIEHCTEGYKILSYLKEASYPVTLGPFMGQPGKEESRQMNLENPRIIDEAGILFAINTDHPVTPIEYLSVCAADAVRHGLDETSALRAITINAAKICGVDDRVGSIEIGKDSDFALWSDYPFRTKAQVMKTIINGHTVFER